MAVFTRVVDRAFEEAILNGAVSNVDGDVNAEFELPVGFGDCALLEASAVVTSIATLVALTNNAGPVFRLLDAPAGNIVDVAFEGKWTLFQGTAIGVACRAGPDQVQFWREQETLRVSFPEIDSNATPTADLNVVVKVRRLRPALSRTAEETHFFLTS